MLHSLKRYYQQVKEKVYYKRLSLAEKCRLQFGGAVLFSLILALLIPFFWMNKLAKKTTLDSGRAISRVFYENHFKIGVSDSDSLPLLSERGGILNDPNQIVRWIRLNKSNECVLSTLSETERGNLELLRTDDTSDDIAWTEKDMEDSRYT